MDNLIIYGMIIYRHTCTHTVLTIFYFLKLAAGVHLVWFVIIVTKTEVNFHTPNHATAGACMSTLE